MRANIKKHSLGKSILSLLLCMVTVCTLFSQMTVSVFAAGEKPGTAAYYDARWGDAKVAAGFKNSGTTYTNNTGANTKTTNAGPWQLELNWGGTCSNPWNGDSEGTQPLISTTVTSVAGDTLSAYEVSTAEELRWCIVNHVSFKLMKDIDLNGYMKKSWTEPIIATAKWVAEGNGHTIYNYYGSAGIFGRKSNIDIKNLRVKNSYLNTTTRGATFFILSGLGQCQWINYYGCVIEDSLIYSNVNGKYGSVAGFACNSGDIVINSCYTNNLHMYAKGEEASCVAQIAVGLYRSTISNTFAMNGSVVGNKGHNGGFVSCIYERATIDKCFNSNVYVYGNEAAGSFLGVLHQGRYNISNCFTSGKVEGTKELGGFLGAIAPQSKTASDRVRVNIANCYSTALVGVQKGQISKAGGFTGSNNNRYEGSQVNYLATYKNCYAAGETGSLSTNSYNNRGSEDRNVAGFVGNRAYVSGNPSSDTYSYCYYDAQMTGMRNWAMGDDDKTQQYTSDQVQELYKEQYNIKSVLTSDSIKCGTGLTSAPSSNGDGITGTPDLNRSFTGFADNSEWTFIDDYYPQLRVFTAPATFTNTNWMNQTEMNNLVRACSLASVSTAKLNTWDKDYAQNTLPKDTYDTVRDVVSASPLTSTENVSWSRCGVTGEDTLATGTGAKTTVFGESRDVLTLENNVSGGWEVKDPYPGVDWLRSTATVDGQTAFRVFRICPTTGLDPGASKTINFDTTYDHADDMKMVYTTGARWTANISNMTYGVYPDNPLATAQSKLLKTGDLINATALKNLYKQTGQNDAYKNIDVGNMQRTSKNINSYPAATTNVGNTLNTIIQKGTSTTDLSDSMGEKFNGIDPFAVDDAGSYQITYYWSLNDGRFLTGSKVVRTPAPPGHTVTVTKSVVAGPGATITGDEKFKFSIGVQPERGKPFISDYTCTQTANGITSNCTWNAGDSTFRAEIGNEDRINLEDIPDGYIVFVREYDKGAGTWGTTAEATGTTLNNSTEPDGYWAQINQNATIAFTNTKQASVTHVLTVTKEVPDAPADFAETFEFTVDIVNGSTRLVPADGTYSVVDANGNTIQRTIDKASNGRLTVSLGNGEKLVVTAIPVGYTAEVREAADNRYEASYIIDPNPAAQLPQLATPLPADRIVTQVMDADHEIAVINEKALTEITVNKTVVGGSQKSFSFRLEFDDPSAIQSILDFGMLPDFPDLPDFPGFPDLPGIDLKGVYNPGTSTDLSNSTQPMGETGENDESTIDLRGAPDIDVSGPKVDIDTPDIDVTGPKVDIDIPPSYRVENDAIVFELKDGEQITIPGIPVGTKVTITETSHDGYTVSIYDITAGRTLLKDGDTAELTLDAAKTIEVQNNSGVELPSTGGIGTHIYTIGGLLMMFASAVVFVFNKRRRERRYE